MTLATIDTPPPRYIDIIFNFYNFLSFIPSVHSLQNSDNNVLCSSYYITYLIIFVYIKTATDI